MSENRPGGRGLARAQAGGSIAEQLPAARRQAGQPAITGAEVNGPMDGPARDAFSNTKSARTCTISTFVTWIPDVNSKPGNSRGSLIQSTHMDGPLWRPKPTGASWTVQAENRLPGHPAGAHRSQRSAWRTSHPPSGWREGEWRARAVVTAAGPIPVRPGIRHH